MWNHSYIFYMNGWENLHLNLRSERVKPVYISVVDWISINYRVTGLLFMCVAFWVAWQCRLALVVFFCYPYSPPIYFSTDLFSVTPPYCPLTSSVWPPLLISTDLFSVTGVGAVCGGSWLGCRDSRPLACLAGSPWKGEGELEWARSLQFPIPFPGEPAMQASQPWERYFSSGALAPNLQKVMQLLTYS